MAFDDLVAKLSEGVENIGDVTAYVAELQAEHNKALEQEVSIREAKISALNNNLTASQEALKEQKLTNYDLITKTGVSGGTGEPEPATAPKAEGINSLFKPKEL